MQTTIPIEQLVMDGGSTDGSVETLAEFARKSGREHLVWLSEPDRGQSHAINKGLRAAKGEYIGWLNADDRYRPGCFTKILQAFDEHPDIDVIYGDYTWMDGAGRMLQLRREISFNRFVLLYHRVLYIPTTAMFFRRRILDAGHLLNESLHYAMDFEFFLRLSSQGYRFLHISETLADFRVHPGSKSCRFPDRQLQEQNKIMREYSSILRTCAHSWVSRPLSAFLRATAAACRYAEKTVRGYYFSSFDPR